MKAHKAYGKVYWLISMTFSVWFSCPIQGLSDINIDIDRTMDQYHCQLIQNHNPERYSKYSRRINLFIYDYSIHRSILKITGDSSAGLRIFFFFFFYFFFLSSSRFIRLRSSGLIWFYSVLFSVCIVEFCWMLSYSMYCMHGWWHCRCVRQSL